MKKSMIAAGAASVALAAMPIVGAFATLTPYGLITDKITTTVGEACSMSADDTAVTITVPGNPSATPPVADVYGTAVTLTKNGNPLVPGDVSDSTGAGTALSITCNSEDGWNLNADAHVLENAKGYSIAAGQYISAADAAADSTTATTTSVWSTRFTLTGTTTGAKLATGADAFKSTPVSSTSGAVPVAMNTTTSHDPDPATADAASGAVVTPYYMVFVDSTQEQGTYTGTITYTLTYGS